MEENDAKKICTKIVGKRDAEIYTKIVGKTNAEICLTIVGKNRCRNMFKDCRKKQM